MDTLSSFDQINLGATIIQSALVVAFAVAIIGVRTTFRRPAMRALALYWALFASAALVNIFSSWSGAIWHERLLSLALTTCVVALHGAAIPVARASVGRLANADGAADPARAAWLSGAATWLIHGAGAAAFVIFAPDFRVGVVTWSRTVHFVVLLLPALIAWRAWSTARRNRPAVLLLAWGFTALALRAAIEVGFGLRVGKPELPFAVVVAAIVVNVVAMMTMGVASLLATAAEEQGVMLGQASLLQQTQEKLARMERWESLGRLAGGVAHDFNNVLAVIKLSADDGASRPQPEAKDADFAEINRATARGAALVKQLLTFARQEPENVRALDASAHIANMTAMLGRLAEPAHLRFDASPAPATVRVDPSQFDQVVLNLVVNARDAMPGGGRVVVSTTVGTERPRGVLDEQDDAARYVCIAVEDTGPGIPPDVLPHIFEPFFSTKPSDRGTGLGLPTVQSIVHRAGGDVTVSSPSGKGTRIEVYLPAFA